MVDVKDDAKGGFRRIEVLTGSRRRRVWSDEDKTRIVEESLAPGARVSEVARRWQVCPQQVFGWRRERRVVVSASATHADPQFVPLVSTLSPAVQPSAASSSIKITLCGAVVHMSSDTDPALLISVLRAVRASVGPA